MMSIYQRYAGIATFVGFCMLFAAQVAAQPEISDAKLQAFGQAAIQVEKTIAFFMPQINAAKTKDEAKGLVDKANSVNEAAIVNTEGVTLEEYRQINDALRTDVVLLARVRKIIDSMSRQ